LVQIELKFTLESSTFNSLQKCQTKLVEYGQSFGHTQFMKKIIILLCIISFEISAYELLNFSNTPQRTIDEIITESGLSKKLISKFGCGNFDRTSLFTRTTIANLKLDSLKVMSKTETFTYRDGALYDINSNRIYPKDKFVINALRTLIRFETVPEAKELIFELQQSPFPFYIKKGGNRYSANHNHERPNWHMNEVTMIMNLDDRKPMVLKLPFEKIGFGGQILWNPNTDAKFMEADWVERKIDTDIILVHEMMHAYDGMRGLLDRRFVKSDEHEFQPVAEYRAVRMENILRYALGYQNRRFYSYTQGDTEQKDMLDPNGETIILPAPCIGWIK